MASTSWSVFCNEIFQLNIEIKTEKITARQKALERLDHILTTRTEEIKKLLNESENVTWNDLFESCYIGLLKHCGKLEANQGSKMAVTIENKNSLYSTVIQKIVTYSNIDSQNIPYSLLFEKIFSILDDPFVRQHFGICFLQIFLKNVLNSKGQLTDVTVNEWSQILYTCIFMFKNENQIPKPFLSECINNIIKIGLEYSYLSMELCHYLKDIDKIINKLEKGMILYEWVKIAEIVCRHMAIDFRFSICELTENIIKKVTSEHEPKLDNDIKIIIFQLCHISIVVHNPNMNSNTINYTNDKEKWNKCLKYIYLMIEREIKYLNAQIMRYSLNPDMCPVLIQLASRLCYIIFWNDDIWKNEETTEEGPANKRVRRAQKLQSLINLVEMGNNKFCWRWFSILAELLYKYPEVLTDTDFQPILQLISNFQATIHYPIQVKAVVKCCTVLLSKEEEFLKSNNTVVTHDFCEGIWNKITEMAFRSSTSNITVSPEYHHLLSLLIKYKKYPSNNFICNILKTYSENAIEKSDMSVKTLIAIFETININILENSTQVMIEFLNWLYLKSNTSFLKATILSNDKISVEDKANITILCLISSPTDNLKKKLYCDTTKKLKYNEETYEKIINDIEIKISLKSLKAIILSDINDNKDNTNNEQLFPLEVRCVLNEKLNDYLVTLMTFYTEPFKENIFDNILKVCSSIEFCLHLLNNLIIYGALNEDKLRHIIFMKKLNLMLQTLEISFDDLISISKLENKEIIEILDGLHSIFKIEFHFVLGRFTRARDFSNILKWINKLIIEDPRKSKHFEILNVSQLEGKEKIRFNAFKFIAVFIQHDSINLEQSMNLLDDSNLNIQSNLDVNIILHLIKIICRQPSCVDRAIWVINYIKDICVHFNKHQSFSEFIIDVFSDLLYFVKEFPDLTKNTIIALRSFILKCKMKIYSPRLAEKIIKKIKHLGRSYPYLLENESFENIYHLLGEFLLFPNLSVQYSAVKCLGCLFNKNWLIPKDVIIDLTNFHQKLFTKIDLKELFSVENATNDYKQNVISVNVHLLSSLLSVNYLLRRNCLFLLLKFSIQENVPIENVTLILNKTCSLMNIKTSSLIQDHIEYLISNWLINDIPIMSFPWNLSESNTQQEFFYANKNILTICFLNHKSEMIGEFQKIMNISIMELIKPILNSCLAGILPLYAKCSNLSLKNKTKLSGLHKNLLKHITDSDLKDNLIKNVTQIIQYLFMHLIDESMFKSMFEIELKFCNEENSVNTEMLMECLQYLKTIVKPSEDVDLITHFCINEPFKILQILNAIKFNIKNSKIIDQKLEYIFRYCILIKLITNFMNLNTTRKRKMEIVGFLMRDTCYFMCSLMSSTNDECAEETALCLKFFLTFCQLILPNCAKYFQIHLNYVVSKLIPLCKHKDEQISKCSIDILNFLIIDNQILLENGIELLDDFPKQDMFEKIRTVYMNIKYKINDSSLSHEIVHFLKVKNRKIEGIIGLREQLASKKSELSILYKNLSEMRGFSEDCEKSDLHKLICELLQCVQSNDIEKSVEAAKCLGELGPADLKTMVLKPYIKSSTYKMISSFNDACINFLSVAYEKLNTLLFDADMNVVNRVCDSCCHLAKTEIGRHFIDDFDELKIFLVDINEYELLFIKTKEPLTLELFYLEDNVIHSTWIKKITGDIFKLLGNKILSELAYYEITFAERMLPVLSQIILHFGNSSYKKSLQNTVKHFFEKHFEFSKNVTLENTYTIYIDKLSIKLMMDVVECIRMYNEVPTISHKIKLDYLHIAQAALYCEAYFSSVLYCELWSLEQPKNDQPIDSNLQDIMKKSYISIGDLDATSVFLDPIYSRMTYLQLGNSWDHVCLEYDATYTRGDTTNVGLFKNSLINSGLYYLASSLPQCSDAHYESAWRMADWSVLIPENKKTQNSFEEYHYAALQSLYNRDELGVINTVQIARKSIIDSWKHFSFECTESIYKNMLMLQQLQQIEDFSEMQFKRSEELFKKILNKWSLQDKIQTNNFKYKEPILSQRASLYQTAGLQVARVWARISPEPLQNILLKIVTESRQESYKNIAIRNLAKLKSLELTKTTEAKALLEDSQLNWIIGDKMLAKTLLLHISNEKAFKCTLSKIVALRLYGEYLAESRSESPKNIFKNYFKQSLSILDQFSLHKDDKLSQKIGLKHENFGEFEIQTKLEIYNSITKYSDREYIQKNIYLKSPEFERKRKFITINRRLIEELTPKFNNNSISLDDKKTFVLIKKNVIIDTKEIQHIEKERDDYLSMAIIYILKSCILNTSKTDLCIFRLISLWFSNKTNTHILNIIDNEIKYILSYKYLNVMPQLSARLNNDDDQFGKMILKIIERCAIDHPHHTLYQIFSIANSNKDDSTKEDTLPEPRIIGAENLLNKLKENPKLSSIIIQMEQLCLTLINVANKDVKQLKNLNDIDNFGKLKNIDLIQCPTLNLPISLNCDYNNITSIIGWSDKVVLVGGINVPRKISCLCSDGINRPQLLKGHDDLRQDAVMQQVFTIMNEFLKKDKDANKRKLSVRTYKVIPLSKRSGILEWCQKTIPIGVYLIGPSNKESGRVGAHTKYRPNDLTPLECREKMTECQKKASNNDVKYQTYIDICNNIQPVFQYFFIEHFHNPGVWFERRLAYVNSLATNSMIGYILGIGDRHVQNILIDKTTGEVIHIDFGIAFEQGKVLPTPETVPFRLSRDIIAPMGVSGVNGVFRKSCEKTMEVLRKNQETIITILEVLLYDPLYAWTLTNKKAYSCQEIEINFLADETIEEKNITAERALMRLQAKLNGEEDGAMGMSLVEAQIDRLIQQAINPNNLCKLFYGWQPYL